MAKAKYEKPASQVDLEARQKSDYVPPSVKKVGTDAEPSENGYVGVDPIYQNYANDTDGPQAAESGPEAKVESDFYADEVDYEAGATPEGEKEAEEDAEEEDDDDDKSQSSASTTTPSTPPPPGRSSS